MFPDFFKHFTSLFPTLAPSLQIPGAIGLVLAGAAASFINMLAGGGSLITLTFLVFLGIDPALANTSNRLGVTISCASGAASYRHAGRSALLKSLRLALWTLPGAIAGAFFSLQLEGVLFKRILTVVMIFVIATLLIPTSKKSVKPDISPWKKNLMGPLLLITGFYGGFIQVGVGFLLGAVLKHLGGMDLEEMNMHRICITFFFTLPVLILFALSGSILWPIAVTLSIGNAIGSWLTVKLAIKKGSRLIKIGMAAAILIIGAGMFIG
ncbi:MAG: sulfite exporter TauE/SafE family protein [Spirochaetales bacterium]|nr:sulfite exporter TauE/SafE family protein [Spirochaetales bacterium]